ncbi:hypothetical protein AHiyo4_34470 [Arthrobacter sp. Hiyo4]|nr:hypothetical protein AHiyo4_34470 [Arthrobacter sp. Hiyo4]
MTNLEVAPQQELCPPAGPEGTSGPCLQLWPEREVPLGGVRAMNVRRTLPQRGLPTIGAWCFLDSFGPDRIAMSVLPTRTRGCRRSPGRLRGTSGTGTA